MSPLLTPLLKCICSNSLPCSAKIEVIKLLFIIQYYCFYFSGSTRVKHPTRYVSRRLQRIYHRKVWNKAAHVRSSSPVNKLLYILPPIDYSWASLFKVLEVRELVEYMYLPLTVCLPHTHTHPHHRFWAPSVHCGVPVSHNHWIYKGILGSEVV